MRGSSAEVAFQHSVPRLSSARGLRWGERGRRSRTRTTGRVLRATMHKRRDPNASNITCAQPGRLRATREDKGLREPFAPFVLRLA